MEQRDMIKDEINRLGKVLAKLLSRYLDNSSNEEFQNEAHIEQSLMSDVGIDIDQLLELDREQKITYLQ